MQSTSLSLRKDIMDFSTVPQEVLQHKRQIWVTPGSRQQAVVHSDIKVTDYSKNPPKDSARSSSSQPPLTGYSKNAANFYGTTPPISASNPEYAKNVQKFYGVTPPVSVSNPEYSKNVQKFYGVTPLSSANARPISNNTEFQMNMQRFYLSTPNEDLQFKKNTKVFYSDYGTRSPLVSAGKKLLNN